MLWLIIKQKFIIQETLYSTLNWGTSMHKYSISLLYRRNCSKCILSPALLLFQKRCILWLHGENGVSYQNWLFSKAALWYRLDFLTARLELKPGCYNNLFYDWLAAPLKHVINSFLIHKWPQSRHIFSLCHQ